MDEFDALRNAWEAFILPAKEALSRLKGWTNKILDRLMRYYKKEE